MDQLDVVDAPTICSLLRVTDRTLRTWVSDLGCPSNKDGRARTYSWPDVLSWYVGYASAKQNGVAGDFTGEDDTNTEGGENLTQANLRKTKAEADLKQLALAKLRGQVIGIEDARRLLDRMFATLRSNLLGAAPLLNTRLEGEADTITREAAIRDFMENLCRELATGKIVREGAEEPADAEAIDSLEAAADVTDDDLIEAANELILAAILAAEAVEERAVSEIVSEATC